MRRKLLATLLACTVLALTGCQLARPEVAGPDQDRFCGFYIMHYNSFEEENQAFYGNPHLTAYGQDSVDVEGIGALPVDRMVLFAQKDGYDWVFPGLEGGYSLFVYRYTASYGQVTGIQSNMGPGDGWYTTETDEGKSDAFSGVIYYGPPVGAEADWGEPATAETAEIGPYWQVYRVWETADERIYIDDSGSSYAGKPTGWTFSEDHTYAETLGGGTTRYTVSVKVSIEAAPRLERLTIYQYGADNALLRTGDVPLGAELPELVCAPGTTWVVVEETGPDGTVHTAYDLTGEARLHPVVLLDDAGLGTYTTLTIR